MNAKKFIILTLALAIALITVLTGCSSNESTTTGTTTATETTTRAISPFTDQELQQLLTDASTAGKAATTYKYNTSIQIKMNIDGEAAPGDVNLTMNGAIDTVKPVMVMTMDITAPDDKGGTQSQKIDMYLVENNIYIKMDIPGVGEQWIKTEATEDILKNFNANMMSEQWDAFTAPEDIEYIKEDSARGVNCYVLKITPDAAYLRQYAEQNASQGMEIDWDKVDDIHDLYKDLTYYVWIAKDSKLILKMEVDSTMEFTDDFASSSQISFKTLITDLNMDMEMYDYGVAVNDILPPEAENAMEISPEALLGQ